MNNNDNRDLKEAFGDDKGNRRKDDDADTREPHHLINGQIKGCRNNVVTTIDQ